MNAVNVFIQNALKVSLLGDKTQEDPKNLRNVYLSATKPLSHHKFLQNSMSTNDDFLLIVIEAKSDNLNYNCSLAPNV